MTRKWNVLVPVVAVIPGATADEAIGTLRAQLTAAGFDVYEGEPGCDAFESGEDQPDGDPDAVTATPRLDEIRDDARRLAAEIGDLAGRWDAIEEVDTDLGVEVQDKGERLMLLAESLAAVADSGPGSGTAPAVHAAQRGDRLLRRAGRTRHQRQHRHPQPARRRRRPRPPDRGDREPAPGTCN